MLLEKLTVLSKTGIIRDIPFNLQGLNLIIDDTPLTNDATISGNNVGKTTFIRVIDFCFGSSGKDIYQDKEQGNDNQAIKNFLFDNEVTFHLSLIRKDGSKLLLRRSFKESDDLFINDIKYSLKDYCKELNRLLFHIQPSETKVSLRNLIKKFVRSDSYSENHLYKILTPFSTDSIYEALYFILFGFPDLEILSHRLSLIDKLDKLKKELRKNSKTSALPRLESKLIQIQKLIEEKEEAIKNINLPKTYDDLTESLKNIKSKTSELSSNLGNLNIKIALSQKTVRELHESETQIDPIAIQQLYAEAKKILPNLQKSFEDTLAFHNKMIQNKIKFVEQHINKLDAERRAVKTDLDSLLIQQSRILQLLESSGTFDDLVLIREELNGIYTDKGKIISEIDAIKKLQNDVENVSLELEEVNLTFATYLEDLNSNIQNIFNKYFTFYTEKTHNEKIYIFYNDVDGKFEFDNIQGNVGDGYKKTEIIAFDLAFISYFNELGLDFPKFAIHDKLEIIHKNQIETTFEIADNLNGQFVVSVLKERIAFLGEEYINKKKILELSQDDKFFKF